MKKKLLVLAYYSWYFIFGYIIFYFNDVPTPLQGGFWIGIPAWIATFTNYKYPGEIEHFYVFRPVHILASVLSALWIITILLTQHF